ncbi:MAG: site-specific integrase [Bacteroidetes bacterium]|nr:site-specific integrase [Bacteroidota bacterium]
MTQIQPSATDVATLFEAARDFAREAIPENTRRAYRADWEHFVTWCAAADRNALPATTETVVLYVSSLAASHRIATIRRKVAAISTAHQLAGQETPTRHASLRICLRGITRLQAAEGKSRRYAQPLLTDDILAMIRHTGDSLLGQRDAALILVGFAGAFRRSELVDLSVEDITWSKEGALLRLRRSKTDQTGEAPEKAIFRGSNTARCPVRKLRGYLEYAGIESGPVFRRIRKGGLLTAERLTAQSVSLVLRQYAEKAGIEVERVSGHSLRAGFVTQALISGASYPEIQRQTGHRAISTVTGYDRGRSRFSGNAAQNLGL